MFQVSFTIGELDDMSNLAVVEHVNNILQLCDQDSYTGFIQTAYRRAVTSYLASGQSLKPAPQPMFDFDGDTLSPAKDAKVVVRNTNELSTLESFIWSRIWLAWEEVATGAVPTLGDWHRPKLELLWIDND